MNILTSIKSLFGPTAKSIDWQGGHYDLSRRSDRRRLAVQIQRTTDALTRKDIQDWRDAWQMAINVERPSRARLYDIYADVAIDLHLSGCIEQRVGMVLSRSFKLCDASGEERPEALKMLDQTWFKQLLRYALDARYWGHSLIELGDRSTDGNGVPTYEGVRLIPRKYVIPEFGRVITTLGQSWDTGIAYREAPWTDSLIEVGAPDDLGLYLKAATQTIPKKNALAFWDTFAEIFGMPIRIAHVNTNDDKEVDRAASMLEKMGAAAYGVFREGTDIEVKESSKGDAFNVYDKRIDRANSELSKLVIGQTMTIEDGSSLSQSQTHLAVFKNLVEADADVLRDVVNNQLLPRMLKQGFPVAGLRFEWDESIDYTPEQQKAFEEMVLQHYDVDPAYFEEKYGIPAKQQKRTEEPARNARAPFFD